MDAKESLKHIPNKHSKWIHFFFFISKLFDGIGNYVAHKFVMLRIILYLCIVVERPRQAQ